MVGKKKFPYSEKGIADAMKAKKKMPAKPAAPVMKKK